MFPNGRRQNEMVSSHYYALMMFHLYRQSACCRTGCLRVTCQFLAHNSDNALICHISIILYPNRITFPVFELDWCIDGYPSFKLKEICRCPFASPSRRGGEGAEGSKLPRALLTFGGSAVTRKYKVHQSAPFNKKSKLFSKVLRKNVFPGPRCGPRQACPFVRFCLRY